MKTLILLFIVAFLCVSNMFADDATIVANWTFPTVGWTAPAIPAGGVDAYPRYQIRADSIGDFDPTRVDFDAVWKTLSKQGLIPGEGCRIANVVCNLQSDHGPADFYGAFKVVYDADNIYILLKYHDDIYMGTETVEIMWAPYLNVPAVAANNAANPERSYLRFAQFGAYKATFGSAGFTTAMLIDFNASGVMNLNSNGTNDLLTNNLFLDNKQTPAVGSSGVIESIYTINYQALTGNAYTVDNARPDFNTTTWRALNGGRGISFDIRITDPDADDVPNSDNLPVSVPASYWWHSTSDDGEVATLYSGFIGIDWRTTMMGAPEVINSRVKVYTTTSEIVVEGTTEGETINVYTLSGANFNTIKSQGSRLVIPAETGQVYLVKTTNQTFKVIL